MYFTHFFSKIVHESKLFNGGDANGLSAAASSAVTSNLTTNPVLPPGKI